MRLIVSMVALLVLAAQPAQAAWHKFVNREMGFSVDVPSDPVASAGTYKTGVAGTVPSTIYTMQDRGVTFLVTVVDFSDRLLETASLLQEAIYIAALDLKNVSETLARPDNGTRAVYGRRIVGEQADGSRTLKQLVLTKGKLFIFQTVIPKGQDFNTAAPARFVDSVTFILDGSAVTDY